MGFALLGAVGGGFGLGVGLAVRRCLCAGKYMYIAPLIII